MSSVNPLLLPIKKDVDTIRKTVLTTIIKMLNARKWINDENVESKINDLIDLHTDEFVYKITLDVSLNTLPTYDPIDEDRQVKNLEEENPQEKEKNPQEKEKNPQERQHIKNPQATKGEKQKVADGTIIMVKLYSQKVTGINKSPIIADFINSYKNLHKILVVESMSDKVKQQLMHTHRTEIFREVFLLQNLPDLICSPKFEILTPEEANQMLTEYGVSRKQMKKIGDSDPATLYYFGKLKQIMRITRNNSATGTSVDYRIIVHKSLSK